MKPSTILTLAAVGIGAWWLWKLADTAARATNLALTQTDAALQKQLQGTTGFRVLGVG